MTDLATREDVNVEPIKLLLQQDPNGQADSVVYMEWCISQAVRDLLLEENVTKPFVIMVVEHNGNVTDKYTFPLASGAGYVRLRHPGVNNVHATIIWSEYVNVKKVVTDLKQSLLESEEYHLTNKLESLQIRLRQVELVLDYEYSKDPQTHLDTELHSDDPVSVMRQEILAEIAALEAQLETLDGDNNEATLENSQPDDEQEMPDTTVIAECRSQKQQLLTEIEEVRAELSVCAGKASYKISNFIVYGVDTICRISEEYCLSVAVPNDMYAKEPSRPIKYLASYFKIWQNPPVDQCDMRRRALATLAVLLPVLLAKLIASIVLEVIDLIITGVLLLLGFRDICFDPIKHPLQEMPAAIWYDLERSVWTSKPIKQDDQVFPRYTNRSVFFMFANPPVLLVVFGLGISLSQWRDSMTYLIVIVAVYIVALALLGIANIAGRANFVSLIHALQQRKINSAKAEVAKHKAALTRDLDDISCGLRASRTPSYATLPPHKRTVELRYNHIKTKVCKPFAG